MFFADLISEGFGGDSLDLGWVPAVMTVIYKKKRGHSDTGKPCEDEAEVWVMWPSAGEEGPALEAPWGVWPHRLLTFGILPSKL
jgi:hypothetical protein